MKKIICFFLVVFLSVAIYSNFLNSKIEKEKNINLGNALKDLKEQRNEYTKIEDIPKELINATVSIEDKRFFYHLGFDPIAIGRSAYLNIKNKRIMGGGSTITQQLVKNMFLSQDQSYIRKVNEIILSVIMEFKYSKEEILEMYLNEVYFGAGANGIGEAAKIYFNKEVKDLNLSESSFLAGLPQAPSNYNPYNNLKLARKRQARVLESMVRNNHITKEQMDEILNEKLTLTKISYKSSMNKEEKFVKSKLFFFILNIRISLLI